MIYQLRTQQRRWFGIRRFHWRYQFLCGGCYMTDCPLNQIWLIEVSSLQKPLCVFQVATLLNPRNTYFYRVLILHLYGPWFEIGLALWGWTPMSCLIILFSLFTQQVLVKLGGLSYSSSCFFVSRSYGLNVTIGCLIILLLIFLGCWVK